MADPRRIDYARHNEEGRQVWDAYWAGNPIRVPVGNYTIGPRIWVFDPALNTEGITWRQFSTDPETMFQCQLKYFDYLHHFIPQDAEMGIPAEGWNIFTEFSNYTEAAWLGCEIVRLPDQVEATRPRYQGDRRNEIFDRGIPGPFDGIMGTVREFYEYFVERARNYEYKGKPVQVTQSWHPIITSGPLTIAVDLCGHEILSDLYVDPDYFHRLMDFIVEATITRILAWREYFGIEAKPEKGGLTDDCIEMISVETYRERILPHHRKLMDAIHGAGPHMMHLCGDAQRHFPTMAKEFNVNHFDTGFPIRFETLRDELGPDIHIQGGVHVDILLREDPATVARETERILNSGVARGGKFIMKEANNVAPRTPLANLWAMYETTREKGRY